MTSERGRPVRIFNNDKHPVSSPGAFTLLNEQSEHGPLGCGDDDARLITSISDATDTNGEAELDGFVVVRGETARLCETLRESFPPQCGEPSIEITNIAELDAELTTAEGVSWTDQPVTLTGTITSGILTIP